MSCSRVHETPPTRLATLPLRRLTAAAQLGVAPDEILAPLGLSPAAQLQYVGQTAMKTPEYVTVNELLQRVAEEERGLPPELARLWAAIRQTPTIATYRDRAHFVVGRLGERVIFFADDEDEFGIGTAKTDGVLTEYGLAGDLRDAIACIRQAEGSGF